MTREWGGAWLGGSRAGAVSSGLGSGDSGLAGDGKFCFCAGEANWVGVDSSLTAAEG